MDSRFSQIDVVRFVIEFAAKDMRQLMTLRLVCRFWNELISTRDGDTWHVELYRRTVRSGTLGGRCIESDAQQYFSRNLSTRVMSLYRNAINAQLLEDIKDSNNEFFTNHWVFWRPVTTGQPHQTVALYSQREHSDLLADFTTVQQVQQMHSVLVQLFSMGSYCVQADVSVHNGQKRVPLKPIVMRWNPKVPLSLEAFREHLGWKIPFLGRNLDSMDRKKHCDHACSILLGIAEQVPRIGTSTETDEKWDKNVYKIYFGRDVLVTYPMFFVTLSPDRSFLLGAMAIGTSEQIQECIRCSSLALLLHLDQDLAGNLIITSQLPL